YVSLIAAIQSRDIDDPYTLRIFRYQLELITGPDFAFLRNRQIESRPFAGQESSDNVSSSKANAEFVTGHARLRDHYFRRAHLEWIGDSSFRFLQARSREVLAKHSPGQIHIRQFPAPKFIVLRGVEIDSLFGAAMNR